MRKNAISYFVNFLKIGFAVGVIYWLVSSGAINLSVFKLFLSPEKLIPSLLGVLVGFLLGTERWRQLLLVQNIRSSFYNCFQLNMVGQFFNYVVPGGVGGDVVKAFYVVKENPSKKMGAGISVLLDRVLGLYAMMILCNVFMFLDWERVQTNNELKLVSKSLVLIFLAFTIGLILAFSDRFRKLGWQKFFKSNRLGKFQRFGEKLIHAYESVHSYGKSLKIVFIVILLSLLAQIAAIFTFIFVGWVSGFDVPWMAYFFVVPLGFMVTAVPVSPAGVGVGQMAFYFLFNMYLGQKSQVGPTLITVIQILNFILSISGAYFFVQRKGQMKELEVV